MPINRASFELKFSTCEQNFRFLSIVSPKHFAEILQIILSEPRTNLGFVVTSLVGNNINLNFTRFSKFFIATPV